MTLTIQIGNSDDKLTQPEWSDFVNEIRKIIESVVDEIHFHGFSPADAKWQNACWVVAYDELTDVDGMLHRIKNCRGAYKQDSVAVTTGETKFI